MYALLYEREKNEKSGFNLNLHLRLSERHLVRHIMH